MKTTSKRPTKKEAFAVAREQLDYIERRGGKKAAIGVLAAIKGLYDVVVNIERLKQGGAR